MKSEYEQIMEECKDALVKIERLRKTNKEMKTLDNNRIIRGLREDLDNRYTERIQWTKDTKKKMELLKERDLINNSDKELLKVLQDKVAIETLGINILKRRIQEKEEER